MTQTWQRETAWARGNEVPGPKCSGVASEAGPVDPPNGIEKLPAVAKIATCKDFLFLTFMRPNEAEPSLIADSAPW